MEGLMKDVRSHMGYPDTCEGNELAMQWICGVVRDRIEWEQQEPDFFKDEPDGDDLERVKIAKGEC